MSKRLTFYSSMRTGLRLFSGSTPGCSADSLSAVQKVRSLPINWDKQTVTLMAPQDAPECWSSYLVGSTVTAENDAGWTEVVIPGGLPVLGNLDNGCFTTAISNSSSDCRPTAPKSDFDRISFHGACHQDNRTSRRSDLSEMCKLSCPTNNEVT
jgi:hypothetical protein